MTFVDRARARLARGSSVTAGVEGAIEKGSESVDRRTMSRMLTVEGMSCGHCEETVEEALKEVPGVSDATADRDSEQVTVDGEADTTDLVAAVEEAGYEASA